MNYGTERRLEYIIMINLVHYKHVVFTDRENVPYINPITGTLLIFQVSVTQYIYTPTLISARLPCSCPACRQNVKEMIETCEYKSERIIIIMKDYNTNNAGDKPYGILILTAAQLKAELLER